jgi:polyferredoxin
MPELAKWDNFYVIVGSSAGALIGLQFVILALIAEKPSENFAEAGAAFGSPTVVHFSVVLFLSALLHAPWQSITTPAAIWGILGFVGVAYAIIVLRRMRGQGVYKPQFEDWLFHVLLPWVAYAILALSPFAVSSHIHEALFGVGASSLLLLFIGIHNAWDGVSYHVFVSLPARNAKQRREENLGKTHIGN